MALIKTHTGSTSFSEHKIENPISHLVINLDRKFAGTEKISIQRDNSLNADSEISADKITLALYGELATHMKGLIINKTSGSQIIIPIGTGGAPSLGPGGNITISMEGLNSSGTYTIRTIEDPNVIANMITFGRKSINASSESFNTKKDAMGGIDIVALPLTSLTSVVRTYKNGVSVEHSVEELKALMRLLNDDVEQSNIDGTNLTAISGSYADLAAANTSVTLLRSEVEARLDALEANTMDTVGYKNYLILNVLDVTQIEVKTDGTAYTYFTVKL